MRKVLKQDGKLLYRFPAFSCVRWRTELHTNIAFNDYTWTFHLAEEEMETEINNPLVNDTKVAEYFNIQSAEYVRDNSIFVIAINN